MNRRMEIIKELDLTLSKVSDAECLKNFWDFLIKKRRYFFAGAGKLSLQ